MWIQNHVSCTAISCRKLQDECKVCHINCLKNPDLNKSWTSLAKWLSVRLRTKWFWVQVQLQSLRNLNGWQWNRLTSSKNHIRPTYLQVELGTRLAVYNLAKLSSKNIFHGTLFFVTSEKFCPFLCAQLCHTKSNLKD